jgi:pimeloyl-ACP methyl ester carboxylesterase
MIPALSRIKQTKLMGYAFRIPVDSVVGSCPIDNGRRPFPPGASKRDPEAREKRKAFVTLVRSEWGADNPAVHQLFANYLMPGATKEQIDSFNELQRKTASAECAARYFEATGAIDVVALLPQIPVPTLVMHARNDGQVPSELGRQLATEIPGAKFVALQSSNHILLEQDPATQRFF